MKGLCKYCLDKKSCLYLILWIITMKTLCSALFIITVLWICFYFSLKFFFSYKEMFFSRDGPHIPRVQSVFRQKLEEPQNHDKGFWRAPSLLVLTQSLSHLVQKPWTLTTVSSTVLRLWFLGFASLNYSGDKPGWAHL